MQKFRFMISEKKNSQIDGKMGREIKRKRIEETDREKLATFGILSGTCSH